MGGCDMGVYFEKALSRFEKQKAGALARGEARKNARLLKNARALCRVGKLTPEQKKQRAAEQPARIQAYIDAVFVWCRMSKRKRSKTPAPGAADFGITNDDRAMSALFRSEKWQACYWWNVEEPRETL